MGDDDRNILKISDFEVWYNNLANKLSDDSAEGVYFQLETDKINFQSTEEEIISRLNCVCSGKEKLCCLKLLELLRMKYHFGVVEKEVYLNEGYREKMMETAMNCYDQKDFETAVYVFRKLAEMNDSRAKNNLAYMIRRKETEGRTKPPILEAMMLLREGIEDKEVFSLVNMALIFALDLGEERDWQIADDMFSEIPDDKVEDAFNWWRRLADEGELEGAIVLLWLLRHSKVKQTQLEDVKKLKQNLLEKIEKIPEWLNECIKE